MFDNVYRELVKTVDSNKKAVLMTIIDLKGSVPNEKGGKMLLLEDGKTVGTVGGGMPEVKALEAAIKIFETKKPEVITLDLAPGKEAGSLCGGSFSLYMEPVNFASRLLIFGGGHVGFELYKIGKMLDYNIIIADDRPEFSSRERFPEASGLINMNYEDSVKEVTYDSDTYIVIITKGHVHDYVVLKGLLESPSEPAYIGMIGSRNKVKNLFERLISEGISKEKAEKVYSPIGLDTGGESPQEIAVSIMAEILKVKYGRSGKSLRDL